MKLSAAIRAGCAGSRQIFDRLFDEKDGRDVVGACMVGAGFPKLRFIHDFREKYHAELRRPVKCPECIQSGPVEDILAHMNDMHKMSRELIADFLESRDL